MPFSSGKFNITDGVRTGRSVFQQQAEADEDMLGSLFDVVVGDIADALELCVTKDGQTGAYTEDIDMGGNDIYEVDRIRAGLGDQSNPTFAFESDVNTGIYRVSSNILGISCNGTLAYQFSANTFNLKEKDMTNVTQIRCGVSAGNGSAASPCYSFYQDNNTGFYSDTDGVVSLSLNGVEQFRFNSNEIDFKENEITNCRQIEAGRTSDNGTLAAPAYSFYNDTNTGFFSSANGHIDSSLNAQEAFKMDLFNGNSRYTFSNAYITGLPVNSGTVVDWWQVRFGNSSNYSTYYIPLYQ